MTIKDYPFEAGDISEIKPIGEYMRDLLNDKTAPVSERMRACEWIAEASKEALNAAHKAVCAELRTRLGDGFVVLRELEPNSDVKDVVKFVNALNEGTASTETPAKVFTRKDMKRVNFLTGEGVAEAKEKAISILLDTYRADIALFAKQVFGAKLTADQIKFCEEFRTERTITRHEPTAWGKTYVAAIAVWWSLVCFDDVRVSIFGPCESAIKVGLWRQVSELHARMAEPFKNMFDVSATRISRKTDAPSCFAEYRIVSADNASAARGIHAVNNFVFVDDADGVSEEVIANLHGIFNDRNPKLCLLSSDMSKFAKAKPDAAELFNKLAKALDDIHSFGDELWKRHPGLVDVNTMIASIVEQKRNESTVAYYIDRLNRADAAE